MDLSNEEYHAHPATSKSSLDLISRSPLHYWSRYLDPKRIASEPTAAMLLGTAVHTHVLELDAWDSRYVAAPAAIDRRTKAGKEQWETFRKEAGGRDIISRDDHELVHAMGLAVSRHRAAAWLLHGLPGKAETTHMWFDKETGIQCKCRPDWLSDDGKTIVDLKTTEDASKKEFQRSIAKWGYHRQASWYLDGVEQSTGTRPEQFIFVCVEKKAPYAVAVYVADPLMIESGAKETCAALRKLAECKASDKWPSYSDEVELISLPPWMLPKADGTLPALIEPIQEF